MVSAVVIAGVKVAVRSVAKRTRGSIQGQTSEYFGEVALAVKEKNLA